MKKLTLEYHILTKTYLKPTYLPTYATVVAVVTVVTVVSVVTVMTEVKRKKITHQKPFFHQKNIPPTKKFTKKKFQQQKMFAPKSQNVTKLRNSKFKKLRNSKLDKTQKL